MDLLLFCVEKKLFGENYKKALQKLPYSLVKLTDGKNYFSNDFIRYLSSHSYY